MQLYLMIYDLSTQQYSLGAESADHFPFPNPFESSKCGINYSNTRAAMLRQNTLVILGLRAKLSQLEAE